MLTLRDIVDYADSGHSAVSLDNAREPIPLSFALEVGQQLLSTPSGILQLQHMMLENLQHALQAGQSDALASAASALVCFHQVFPGLGIPRA